MAKVIKGIEIPDFLDFNESSVTNSVVFEFKSTDNKIESTYASTCFHVKNNVEALKQFVAGIKIVYANCFYIEQSETA